MGNSDKRIKNANPNLQIETETPASSLEQLLLLMSLKSQFMTYWITGL
jgi:hypothetical protein